MHTLDVQLLQPLVDEVYGLLLLQLFRSLIVRKCLRTVRDHDWRLSETIDLHFLLRAQEDIRVGAAAVLKLVKHRVARVLK